MGILVEFGMVIWDIFAFPDPNPVIFLWGSWWHPGEPNGGPLENCAAVGPDGLWADYPCETPLPWVCEGPP